MKNFFRIIFIFLLYHNIFSQSSFPVILISDKYDPEELSIAINPKNPAQIVAGANISKLFVSTDTGRTWQSSIIKCDSFGVYGDPVLIWDTSNTFYYFHLSMPNMRLVKDANWIDRIVVQASSDLGKSFNFCTGIGKNGSKNQDKHWAYYDSKTNTLLVSWTQFDKYESKDPKDSSIILFSMSKDNGKTWTTPLRLSHFAGDCLDSDGTVEGATPFTGPNGEIYVAWAGPKGIMFTYSTDGGKTFLYPERKLDTIYGGWDIKVEGLYRANNLPFLVCDNNPKSPFAGNIYICFGDEKDGDKNIWLLKSTDGGKTWSKRIKVNNDNSKRDQFMPMMTIDPITGYLYIIFYDRRNYNDIQTDVYLAVSKDGGTSFNNYKLNSKSFIPDSSVFFGDYIGVCAYNNIVRPIWMEMHNKKIHAYTALIDGGKL
ncbi:MAG: hypothetical protein KatS3mg027_1504 [Bacteroidia bacterium]|nr:MAG: hypothetical protein KatS3mg027_1504 [Bacteroidia bacterium]